jgi:hypothetical protein
MDTHGDRGALDLGTVKSFMYQLLRVRPHRRFQRISSQHG